MDATRDLFKEGKGNPDKIDDLLRQLNAKMKTED